MPVKKYQGGGALNSLINNTEGLDTQPVIGMKRGGSFMEQLLTGGLLSTNKAQDMMKKNPMMTGMLGGAGSSQGTRRTPTRYFCSSSSSAYSLTGRRG